MIFRHMASLAAMVKECREENKRSSKGHCMCMYVCMYLCVSQQLVDSKGHCHQHWHDPAKEWEHRNDNSHLPSLDLPLKLQKVEVFGDIRRDIRRLEQCFLGADSSLE